jgi:hypothetical protein
MRKILVLVMVCLMFATALYAMGGGGKTSGPPLGCYPAGTQCRAFVQNIVYCCGTTPVVGERTGWCIGWYDALPCR